MESSNVCDIFQSLSQGELKTHPLGPALPPAMATGAEGDPGSLVAGDVREAVQHHRDGDHNDADHDHDDNIKDDDDNNDDGVDENDKDDEESNVEERDHGHDYTIENDLETCK